MNSFYVFFVKIEKGLNLIGGHLCEAAVRELAREPLLWPCLTSAQSSESYAAWIHKCRLLWGILRRYDLRVRHERDISNAGR
jgi:hypothetical protein